MPIKYELINKTTAEVYPVTGLSFGDGEVTAAAEGIENVVFSNINKDGNLENDVYSIRQIGTHLSPNNDGVVTDAGLEVPVTPEQASEISSQA